MIRQGLLFVLCAALLVSYASAACDSNSCSVFGSCNADVCECQPGWFSSDCSVGCDALTKCGGVGNCSALTGDCECPIDLAGDNCQCPSIVANPVKEGHYPYVETDANMFGFEGNTLFLSVMGEFVQRRTYVNITFVNATLPECNLHAAGSYWDHVNHNLACRDQFPLRLPWNHHKECGFSYSTANSAGDKHVFISTVIVNYIDELGRINDMPLTRKSQTFFKIYIGFPKIIEVELTPVNITAPEIRGQPLVNGTVTEWQGEGIAVVLTGFDFDVETQLLSVGLTTIQYWPEMFLLTGFTQGPNNVVFAEEPTLDLSRCTNTRNTKCFQYVNFKLGLTNSACSFDGLYTLGITVYMCRNANLQLCTNGTANITFAASTSNVCGALTVKPHLTAELKSYADSDLTVVAKNFTVGTTGYFATTIFSAESNTVTMKYSDIIVKASDNTVITLLDKGAMTGAADVAKTNLIIANELFKFSLFFHPSVFRVGPNQMIEYSFYCKGIVTFTGNDKKREMYEVEMEWADPRSTTEIKPVIVGLRYIPNSKVVHEDVQSSLTFVPNSLYGSVSAVAGLMVVVAAVAVVIVKRRRQSGYTTVTAAL